MCQRGLTMRAFEEIPSARDRVSDPHVPRSARFPSFVGMPANTHERFDALVVAVVGAGSVGRQILIHLAKLMIARIFIVDPGQVQATNFLTHPGLTPGEDLGASKARIAGELVKCISPRTRVLVCDSALEELSPVALADASVVFLATDNLSVEVEAGRRALLLGQKLIQGSVHGPTNIAQVRFFSNADGTQCPCPACAYSREEWNAHAAQTRFSCAGGRISDAAASDSMGPTTSCSFLCSLAADLVVNQAIKHILQLGPAPDDTLLEYAGYRNTTSIAPLRFNGSCPVDHASCSRHPCPKSDLCECSLAELSRAAGLCPATDDTAFTVGDDFRYVETAICNCGMIVDVAQFVSDSEQLSSRCMCGGALSAIPYYVHRPAPMPVVRKQFETPLRQLGAGKATWAMIRQGKRAGLVLQNPDRREDVLS